MAQAGSAPHRSRPRTRRLLAVVALVLTALAWAARLGWLGTSEPLDPARLQHNGGQAYTLDLGEPEPSVWRAGPDGSEAPRASRLVLFEDGRRLGPAHASHAAIREQGGGRYSHWGRHLYLSSSDGSDPRSNGRTYAVRRPPAPRDELFLGLVVVALALTLLAWPRLPLVLLTGLVAGLRRPRYVEQTADGRTRRRAGPVRWLRPLLLLALVALLLEGAAWIALELGGRRAFAPGFSPHRLSPWRGHRLDPDYAPGLHSPDGFREPAPVSLAKPADSYRIIAVGGSTLYGLGAGQPYPTAPALTHAETLDHHLERRLNARLAAAGDGRRVEVINAGVTGYETFQHLVHLNERLADYDPDLLLCLDGYNDWFRAREGRHPWGDYPYASARLVETLDEGGATRALWMLTRAWREHSFAAEWLFERLDAGEREVQRAEALRRKALGRPLPPERYGEYARASFLRNYRQMATLCEDLGAGLLIALQPAVYFEDEALLSPADRERAAITGRFLEGRLRPAAEQQLLRDQLPALFAQAGLAYLDCGELASPATTGEQLYLDYVHLTGAGSDALAARLEDAVWERLQAAWR